MRIGIVDISSQEIVLSYEADAADQGRYGGPWGDPAQTVHLEYPVGEPESCCKVQDDGAGNLSLVLDPALKTAWKVQENCKARDAFYTQKDAEAEAAIKTALFTATGEEADYETHLAKCAMALDILTHQNDHTAGEISDANAILDLYRPVWTQIETIRSDRDAVKDAFTPPYTDVDPLYG